jgi:nitroreductase
VTTLDTTGAGGLVPGEITVPRQNRVFPGDALHPDVDHVLTTTRSVRRRLDFDRPVDRATVEECLSIALQAPSGASRQDWRFVAVDEPSVRAELARVYRATFLAHYGEGIALSEAGLTLPPGVSASARHLADNFARVPVVVVPYRLAPTPTTRAGQASFWASILPAAWSFMLAARSRGLATSYVARGLDREQELAELLGIPYPDATQAGMIAVAQPDRQDFRPARRQELSAVMRWNSGG